MDDDLQPLVTDDVRRLIGQATTPVPLALDIPSILRVQALTGYWDAPRLDAILPPWLVAGVSPGMGMPTDLAPPLLPETALIQTEWQFFRPFPTDRPLFVAGQLTDIRDRVGGRYGHTVMATTRLDVMEATGEVVAAFTVTRLEFAVRDLGAFEESRPSLPPPEPPGSAPDGARAAAAWVPHDRWFEDVVDGEAAGPEEWMPDEETCDAFLPVSRRLGSTQSNNAEMARRQGYEGLVVPIQAQMCWVGWLATRWAGRRGELRLLRVAVREPDYLGRPIVVSGRVVDRRQSGSEGLVDLEFETVSAGRISERALVQVAFPLRDR
jgi:hypothetical protein